MRLTASILAASVIAVARSQVYQGFNYGSVFTNNAPITQQDYEDRFNTAKGLQDTSGFTSARLFTMIQAGTANSPTLAIPAASATNTKLLLGLFLSSTDAAFENELAALRAAISQYGQAFVDSVIGISVGSEDLYRISPIGIENKSNPGEGPDVVVRRINAVRAAIAGTILSGKPVGHVDTWTAYVNASNSAVIAASDFIGTDAYPYFQNTMPNAIENGESLFFEAYNATVAVSQGKPVWITETGWPVSGPISNQAVASLANAKTYWDDVGCRVFGEITTFWYTLQDAFPDAPSPSFGVVGSTLSTTPLYDLSCPADSSPSSSAGAPSSTAKASVSSASVAETTSTEDSPSSLATSVSVAPTAPNDSGTSGPSSAADNSPSTESPNTPQAGSTAPLQPTTLATITTALGPEYISGSALPSPTARCPTDLAGAFEFPHLIIPVDSSQPATAFGTSYTAHFSPTVSSIFNFDYPASTAGRTCSLVFLFPNREDLQTSNYTLSGAGGIVVERLFSEATEGTTYANQPEVNVTVAAVESLREGEGYSLASGPCFVSRRVTYKVSATEGLDLEYFQDFNPSPIGLYVRVC